MRVTPVIVIAALCLTSLPDADSQEPLPARQPATPSVAPLTAAVLRRDLSALRRLLEAGQDPNQNDDQGFSPWKWANQFEENAALILLLARVPRISDDDAATRRQLAVAASLDNHVAIRALLAKGVVPTENLVEPSWLGVLTAASASGLVATPNAIRG